MKTIVSIVNYNTKELTIKCLRSVFNSDYKDIEVWVVDNSSSDGSVEIFKKKFPGIKLIANNKNLGFGKAHNQVLKKAQGDNFLVLNSDTEVEKETISQMVKFMDTENCGIASCKVMGFDGKLQPNGGDLPFGLALLGWLFNLEWLGVKSSFHQNKQEYYQETRSVGWVSGNFMMIESGVIEKVGYFNEAYFMYFEDVEFCYSASKKGFKVMINPKVSIKHLSGGSLDNPHLRQWSGEYKGLILFYSQNFGKLVGFLIQILVYKSILFRMVAFALIGKINYSLTYAKVFANL